MKKAPLFIFVAILSACTIDESASVTPIGPDDDICLTAAAPPETKVYFSQEANKIHPGWETDDRIIGFTGNGSSFTYEVESVDATTGAATLKKVSGDALAVGDHLYAVYCPGSKASDIQAGE